MNKITLFASAAILLLVTPFLAAQPGGFNYDESKVPKFDLPELLVAEDGTKIASAKQWQSKRRAEIYKIFEEQMYGRSPAAPKDIRFEIDSSEPALDGKAIRKQVRIYFKDGQDLPAMEMLIYQPPGQGPFPAFIGLNFGGNHTVHADPKIKIPTSWARSKKDNKASADDRGNSASRWQVEKIVSRGYAVATIYYGDIDPDFHDEFQNGIHPLFYRDGQKSPDPDEWGSIAAWSYGLSRGLDYLVKDPDINGSKVAVLGHSRLGKTSLWAGASDTRFAIVISNDSGCGGAALNKRAFGETVKRITTSFPHWFCDNFDKYGDNEKDLAFDQHMLMALIAPRPVYVASAEQDQWADPHGEFLSVKYAGPVYKLFGKTNVPTGDMPKVDEPFQGDVGYHIRQGKHDVTLFDWEQYLNFADRHMKDN
ncbi:MAG: hypothetical protein ACI9G1_001262 [Pirellulaceae bacterium]|jgi:hypothetical protein